MKVLLVIVAAAIGAQLMEWPGLIFGATLGWLAGAYIEFRHELRELRSAVENLSRTRSAPTTTGVTVAPERVVPVTAATPVTKPPPIVATSATIATAPTPTDATYASAWTPAPAPTAAATTRAPATEDTIVDKAIRWIKDYFTGGNTLVRVGAIILFFGVGFLLKYAAEHTRVPIELRLAGVAFGAIVLLILGWRLRSRRADYALALQGTAIGILYLVVFAAFRLYTALPGGMAFVLLAAICVLAAALAVMQDSLTLAVLGAIGGFLAPILASTGDGSHVGLFSYYLILNLGILGVAWFKAWRPLNVVGFVFTFIIGTAWGVLKYRADLFVSTEPFLIAFFLLFVAIGVLFAARQPPQLRGYVDSTIVFGTPIVAFGLQAGMLRHDRFALALSAAAVSALYLGAATLLLRAQRGSYRILTEAFWALGVVFATLTVPLALDGHWTAATWALEGVAVLWLGGKQNRKLARAFGVLLQLAAGLSLLHTFDLNPHVDSSFWLDAVVLASAAVMSAWLLSRLGERSAPYEPPLIPVLFFIGLAWWLAGWISECVRQLPSRFELHATLLVIAISAALCSVIARRLQLSVARLPALCLLPVMILFAAIDQFDAAHPVERAGFVTWPMSFALLYWILWRDESTCSNKVTTALHSSALWLLIALTSWEVAWGIDQLVQGSGSWPAIAWASIPALALYCLPRLTARLNWPLATHRIAYLVIGGAGMAAYLLVWSFVTNLHLNGDPYPLPYVPLLNPLDLAQVAVLLAVVRWWLACERQEIDICIDNRLLALRVLGVALFVWLNAVLLRTLHHWAGVPYELDAMLRSTLVQTSLSIFWTLLALATMVFATRRTARPLWFVGAALMGVVVLKLFLVDLSRIGTVERIVSFIAVGILMLVIGYFAPLPPAQALNQERA